MTNAKQSFNGTQSFSDMTKMFSAFTLPGFNTEALMAFQRKNVEAFTQASQLTIEGVQAFARRQAELTREAFGAAPTLFQGLSHPTAPQEQTVKNAAFAKNSFEKGLANARELTELCTKANSEAFDVIAKRMTESFEEIRDIAAPKAV